MDERSNLINQIKVIQDDLRRTRSILGSVLDNDLITIELHQAINSRIQNLLNQWDRRLKCRLRTVDSTDSTSLNIVWKRLQADRQECDAILKEFLSFLGGALIRQSNLDNCVCAIADRLLADLSLRSDIPWTRMTILGEGDFFADMTEIIRLRFPEFTIWNLPIVGHEFGHFVGRELRKKINDREQRDFFREIIEQEGKQNLRKDDKKKEEDHLYEHLADIFATYSLGLAFALTSILLKFNPNKNQDGESHPSDVKRAYIILKTLEKMNEVDRGDYGIIIQRLRECWQESLNQLERLTTLLPSNQEKNVVDLLDNRLDKLFSILDNEISNVCYKNEDWLCTLTLNLSDKLTKENLINLHSAHQYKLIDVLNAAWRCRLSNPEKEDDINKNAINLCKLIINYGQS